MERFSAAGIVVFFVVWPWDVPLREPMVNDAICLYVFKYE